VSSIKAIWSGGVDKYEIFSKLLDILFQLLQVPFAGFFLVFNTHCVELAFVGESLVLLVNYLPLLFEGLNQLLSLLVREQELGSVSFVLLLNLHLSY